MKYLALLFLILALLTFSSCAVVNALLGYDTCDYSGCEREAVENCNYCGFHCDSYIIPTDFNAKVGKSIDEQVKKSNRLNNYK